MNKYFEGVKTVEELRKQYRELLKKFHPDNEGGSVEVTQEINAEYDR
ncbi:J domain-containing protein, partial [Lachnospiraceae bacterium]|nr:J domain-containing protein [Lachnospiraceae bacterium]